MSTTVPTEHRPPRRPRDDARVRAWLVAAASALLVLVYLCAQLTYASTHLPPARYRVLAPGAPAHAGWADFELTSISRTQSWGHAFDGGPGTPDADTEWVVADLQVTPRHLEKYMLCTLRLVSTDGRSWESEDVGPTHEGDSCPGDDDDPPQLGRVYPIVVGFEIPVAEVDRVAGLSLDPYSGARYQLLRPPA